MKTEATKQFKVAEAAPTPPADPGGSKTVTEFEGDEKGKGQGKKGVHDRGQGKNERNEGKDDWFLKRWFAGLLGKGEEGGGVKGKERGNRNRNSEGRTDGKGKGKAKEGDNGGNVGEVEKHGKRRKLILKIKKKFGRSSKG